MRSVCRFVFAITTGLISSPLNADTHSASRLTQAFSESTEDIANKLATTARKNAVFESDFIDPLHQAWDEGTASLYEATGIDLGIDYTVLYQHASNVLPSTDKYGAAGDLDVYGRWDLVDPNGPWAGSFYFSTELRHAMTDTTPAQLRGNIGSIMGTIDGFGEQDYLITNAFWRQGSKQAGFMYQIGRMAPDGLINISRYNNPNTNFHPIGLVGSLTISFPGHGFGAAAIAYPTEDTFITAVITDANGQKKNLGALNLGEFFSAVELGYKPNFGGSYEGRHALTFWHVDARSQTGVPSGHGFALKLEQELDATGNLTGLLRYSKSFGSASTYDNQASVYLIMQNISYLENDMLGIGVGWADPTNPTFRNEYIAEAFYRFPLTPRLDMSISLQTILNPAANINIEASTVASVRLRKTF